jgi:hypothetical protein
MGKEIVVALVVLISVGACSRTADSGSTVSSSAAPVASPGAQAGAKEANAAPPIIQPSRSPDEPTKVLDARADEVLRAMSAFMASTMRFAFEAEETYDDLPGGEPRVLLSNVRRIAVERPNRFYADVEGDSLNRSVWFDGRSVFTLDKPTLTYSTFKAPVSFYADAYSVLTEQVTYSRYLGLHRAAGVLCHHLVFSQPTIEWQIWIETGERPMPRKMVITYVREPGEPQYSATITKWNLAPVFPDGLFAFEVPEGAEHVDAAALIPTLSGGAR